MATLCRSKEDSVVMNLCRLQRNLLMSLQEKSPSLAAPDVPHDDAVVWGPWKKQPLDRVPPQRSYTTCKTLTSDVRWLQLVSRSLFRKRFMIWPAGTTQCLLGELQAAPIKAKDRKLYKSEHFCSQSSQKKKFSATNVTRKQAAHNFWLIFIIFIASRQWMDLV